MKENLEQRRKVGETKNLLSKDADTTTNTGSAQHINPATKITRNTNIHPITST